MISTRQSGFTLVELLIVSLLTAVIMVAVYETLMVQEKSYEAARHVMSDQEALRTGIAMLETELREAGAIGGVAIGGSDIAAATADSITFRAHRKLGAVCDLSRNDKWLLAWPIGEKFEAGDELLFLVDGDTLRHTDDRWDTTFVSTVSDASTTSCTNAWPGQPLQQIKIDNAADLSGVYRGAPIRAYEWTTYSLYEFGSLGWGLGRVRESGSPTYLVGRFAPKGTGLRFAYFDTGGNSTLDPTQVSRIEITMVTDPQTNTPVQARSMTTNLYLRNN